MVHNTLWRGDILSVIDIAQPQVQRDKTPCCN